MEGKDGLKERKEGKERQSIEKREKIRQKHVRQEIKRK